MCECLYGFPVSETNTFKNARPSPKEVQCGTGQQGDRFDEYVHEK